MIKKKMASFFSCRKISYTLLLLLAILGSCHREKQALHTPLSRRVLVTITPYRHFIERIAGDTVTVDVLVPAGANAHSFEPSAKQISLAARADIWFRMGEGFEPQVVQAIKDRRPEMSIIDLRDDVDLLSSHEGHSKKDAMDTHVWLSPRRVKIQAKQIARLLIEKFPEYQERYERALARLLDDLETLDVRIATILDFAQTNLIMVSHPAYSYFCDDYDLHQLSIEHAGKEPTPKQATQIIQEAKGHRVERIFVQPQYSSKGAVTIANEIGASIVEIDPYGEDYFANMRKIAWSLAGY